MKRIGFLLAVASAFICMSSVRAAPITFVTTLAPEAAGATGSGAVTLVYDADAHTLSIDAQWSGLSGTTTVAHIHCCTAAPDTGTAGVAVTPMTLPGFPEDLQAGTYATLLMLSLESTYTASFVTNFGGGTIPGAEAALFQGLSDGTAYFNIHTTEFPGGEIRGHTQAVPEPLSLVLVGLGLLGIIVARRFRTR